ncbi:MAG: TonB-dependent receptor [Halioglobus sp.]
MSRIPFQRSLLATAITSCSLMGGAGMVSAQEGTASADSPMVLEEVVVIGIRGSYERSMDIKRDSQGVVDAISAEDIGKMPDTNLAESLQRITGVSIDRVNGEGSKVTVRGFGPDYNVITLNGRQMPAANIEDTTVSASRSYDFANLAAESVSGVEVFKTGRADLTTGGIGSVINIKTIRPLDVRETTLNLSAKANHDTTNEDGDDWTPEISGIYAQTFADDTFGVAITGSYSERDSGFAKGQTSSGWYTIPGGQGDWGSIPPDSDSFVNPPQPGDVYSVPRNINYQFTQIQRERINAQLALQWAPTNNFTGTLDYTYSELDIEQQNHDMGAWFNGNPVSGEFTQGSGNGSVVAPVIYSDNTEADVTFGAGDFGRTNENKSIGLNLEWWATEQLMLTFDYHDSEAENGAKDDRGSNNIISGVQFNRNLTTTDYSRDLPLTKFGYIDGKGMDPSKMLTSGTSFRNSYMKHEIEQARFDGVFTFDDSVVSSIDFGVSMVESSNRSAYSVAQRDTWGGYGDASQYDDALFQRRRLGAQFDEFSGASSDAMEPYYYEASFDGMRSAIADIATANGESLGPCGPVLCADPNYTTDRTVDEEQSAVYGQVNFGWEDMAMPMHLTLGLRWEDTDVESEALVPQYTQLAWVADNEFSATFEETGFSKQKGGYDHWLPNIDFDIEVREDVVLRASSSVTITRPVYGDLQGGTTINNPVRFNGGTGNSGNTDLDPFESTNLDFSAEWYYSEGSYFSVGYYRKDVENFIGNTTVDATSFDLAHPAQGPRYDDAVAALGTSDAAQVRAYMEAQYGAPVVGSAALGDPSTVFSLITPTNVEEATIDGWEIALQHMFGESGFGMLLNYTSVDGDIEYDDFNSNKGEGVENQFALLGLSDSYNVIGFYDNYGFQARIAYNWRDDFLTNTLDGNNERNPIYTEDYGQWDINLSYQINDSFSVLAEGINITDETQRLYGRHENMVIGAIQNGARYSIGVRYQF